MSKSLKRVARMLDATGIVHEILEMGEETRTAAQAARAAGCHIDQIAKSIIFQDAANTQTVLFITAGGNQVDPKRAAIVAQTELQRADAATVRAQTGFAIGGVAPIAHLSSPHAFFDPRLLEFTTIWAAAGTPRHIFSISPAELLTISGAQLTDFTSQ